LQSISGALKKSFTQEKEILTTFTRDVTFHRAYIRANPADLLEPWLNKAFSPAALGNTDDNGRNKTMRRTASMPTE
jgi:hypothetical protein